MSDYLAVVMSDLHLGEEDSILMDFEDDNLIFEQAIGKKLKKLIRESTKQDAVKYLILAGDVMELSLATRAEAFRSFRLLLSEFADLFETLIYVPGNHDHHIWIALQEEARIFSQIRQREDVKPYYHSFIPRVNQEGMQLPMLEEISRPYGLRTFLYKLLPDDAEEKRKDFLVAYPNVYFDLDRKVFITHGHFFEDTWRIFTDAIPNSLNLTQLSYKSFEQINSPFIEFGWYHLGQAGKLSALMEELWDEMHAGRHHKIDMVVDEIGHYLDDRLEFRPKNKKGFRTFIHNLIGRHVKEFASDQAIELCMTILKKLITSQISSEGPKTPGSSLRHATDIFLDPLTREKIRGYMEIASIDDEFDPDALLFGHTHVPILNSTPEQTRLVIAGKPVVAHNTGGWVADVLEPEHLRLSRPAIFTIDLSGTVEAIEVPWPNKLQFEQITEVHKDRLKLKKEIKKLIKQTITT